MLVLASKGFHSPTDIESKAEGLRDQQQQGQK